jgi:hypothetical protein
MVPMIKRKTGLNRVSYTVASPDMWAKRGSILKADGGMSGESIADVFMKGGVPLRPADNSRVVGWQRIREYLRDAPDGIPYLQVFENCENLIKTIPMLQFDEHNREDARDGNDHAPEALRYGLMSRPPMTREIITPKKNIVTFKPVSHSDKEGQRVFEYLRRANDSD